MKTAVTSLRKMIPAVRKAGRIAMEIYGRDFDVELKDDNSPVTAADIAVDEIVVASLEQNFPDIQIVSEERASNHSKGVNTSLFFLVDPIDGTKEFIKRTGEFTINIALIENGVPIAGIVFAPAMDRLFLADVDGAVVEIDSQDTERPISVRGCGKNPLTAVASRSHNTPETQAFLDKYEIADCVNAGSSLKFCVLAAGEADIYPRFGPTMEWDTAAGDAVLRAAGGEVVNIDRSPFLYGKNGFKNPNFIAYSPEAAKRCPA